MSEIDVKNEPRYKLRETSKVPSRFRDYQSEFVEQNASHGRTSMVGRQTSPKKSHSVAIVASSGSNEEMPMLQEQVHDYNNADAVEPDQKNISLQPQPPQNYITQQGPELSEELKTNLRKLKNVLKLPKARRFVFCEYFYSGVDQQLFLAENEFSQLMKESFPNLKCNKLRKPEWREIRRLIGKPRRCSQGFLNEEREALEVKRQKIRMIYNGTCTSLDQDVFDLPAFLPRPPVVGQKIYARVRDRKDGTYAATVDAIIGDDLRVVFDKEEMIPPSTIKDYEIMFDQPSELMSINYFLEMNRANLRGSMRYQINQLYSSPAYMGPDQQNRNMSHMVGAVEAHEKFPPYASQSMQKTTINKDEKVGNFPVKMLVILVKLCKVVEYKKQLINNLTLMNDNAQKMNLLTNEYPEEFKLQYSQLVLDIEAINKLFKHYLASLHSYHSQLLPHLNEPQPTDRPEVLRKTCNTHAFQIVKHCNTELGVHNNHILQLITSLISILLQVRTIGSQKRRFNVSDLSILNESLKQVRADVLPTNVPAFQNLVEIHMKQITKMMLKSGVNLS